MLPLAHAGHYLVAMPFVVPPLILIGGLLFLTMRDRRRGGESE